MIASDFKVTNYEYKKDNSMTPDLITFALSVITFLSVQFFWNTDIFAFSIPSSLMKLGGWILIVATIGPFLITKKKKLFLF